MHKSVVLRSALICSFLAVAGWLYLAAQHYMALGRESGAFVKDAVMTIGAHWDTAALWQRATPDFRDHASQDDFRAKFDAASKALGPVVDYRAVAAEMKMPWTPISTDVAANYIVKAGFEKGEAELELHVVKTGATWRIDAFSIGASPEMKKYFGLEG
jgi:hypothetical protein